MNSACRTFSFSGVRQEVRPAAAPCGFLPSSYPALASSGSRGGRGWELRCRDADPPLTCLLSQDPHMGLPQSCFRMPPLPQSCSQPPRRASISVGRGSHVQNGRGPVLGAGLCVPTLASHTGRSLPISASLDTSIEGS